MPTPNQSGPRRNPNLSGMRPGPGGMINDEEFRNLRFKADRRFGIVLFALGIVFTVVNMTTITENGLATQAALVFSQYEIGDYVRPANLPTLAWIGVIAHPLNYAVWLYLALVRWRREQRAAWCAFVGAIIAQLISIGLLMSALLGDATFVAWMHSQGG